MNYNRIYPWVLFLLLLSACNGGGSSSPAHHEHGGGQEQKVYTCPMHPQIVRDRPGQCPICGMDLVERKSAAESTGDTSVSFLLKPTNEYVLSQARTVLPARMELPVLINAPGIISYDTRSSYAVSARAAGRIEKLYVTYRYQGLQQGQRLFDLYSPELVTEQENLLFLIKNDPANTAMIRAAENKLMLLGLSQGQVAEIRQSQRAISPVAVYSPYSGYLDFTGAEQSGTGGMGQADAGKEEVFPFKQGMYVEKGQVVLNVHNTENVWAVLSIYPEFQNQLKAGQKVLITIDGDEIETKLSFIEPVIRQGQNFVTARCDIANPGNKIKIGTLVKATIYAEAAKGIYLPASAVLALGQKQLVFVREKEQFRAMPLVTGRHTGSWVEVLSGLDTITPVAANARLLIDSDSFIRSKEQ